MMNARKITAGIIALSIGLAWKPTPQNVTVSKVSRSQAKLDRNLLEITIPQLEALYRHHKYTVTEVVNWYIQRIKKYNGVYDAIEDLDEKGALATAAREDAEAKAGGRRFTPGPMWGVLIVIKENTSIRGLITSDGWKGYKIPGHELVAPRDATIVFKLRAAGAVILGKTNMPDFAASDTNRSTAYRRTGNAYDVRCSPGGSSGGTVTAVTANFALLGNGTDTANSIRMPAATSAVVGEDPMDVATIGSTKNGQPGPYMKYLRAIAGDRTSILALIFCFAGTIIAWRCREDFAAAEYVFEPVTIQGITLPTKRRT